MNTNFWPNDLEYMFKYPMLRPAHLPDIFYGELNQNLPRIQAAKNHLYLSLVPEIFKGTVYERRVYLHPILDPTRKLVVDKLLESIKDTICEYSATTMTGTTTDFFVGAEFHLYGHQSIGVGTLPHRPLSLHTQPVLNRPKRCYEIERDVPPGTEEWMNSCIVCQPEYPYSDELDRGFIGYCKKEFVDNTKLGMYWNVSIDPDFGNISASNMHNCFPMQPMPHSPVPKATEDYLNFLDELHDTLSILQYAAAKQALPEKRYSTLAYHHSSFELAWLHSDYPGCGDFYNEEEEYYRTRGRRLNQYTNIARLCGRPSAFPICSPPGDQEVRIRRVQEPRPATDRRTHEGDLRATEVGGVVPDPKSCQNVVTMQTYNVPTSYYPRCISEDHFRLFYITDLITAGVASVGYYKAILNLGFWGTGPGIRTPRGITAGTERAFQNTMDNLQSISHLRWFMTPYESIVVHLDAVQMDTFDADDTDTLTKTGAQTLAGGAPKIEATESRNRLAGWLVDYLDRKMYPHGIFSNMGVMRDRLFSRKKIGQSVILSPYHNAISSITEAGDVRQRYQTIEMMNEYRDLVRAGSSSGALAFTDRQIYEAMKDGGLLPPLRTEHSATRTLPRYAEVQWEANVNCFLFAFDTEDEAKTVLEHASFDLEGKLNSLLPQSTRPFRVEPAAGAVPTQSIRTSFVTDGLNSILVVSNLDRHTRGPEFNGDILIDAKAAAPVADAIARYEVTEVARARGPTGEELPPLRVPAGSPPSLASISLGARETKVFYIAAVPTSAAVSGSELGSAVDTVERQLKLLKTPGSGLMGGEFDVDAGLELVDYLRKMPDEYPERVLAGLVRLQSMLFLDVSRTGRTIHLDGVRYLSGPVKLANLELQVLHLLNGHEEQKVDIPHDQDYRFNIGIDDPKNEHYDLRGEPQTYKPLVARMDVVDAPVELHVYDNVLGVHTYATVVNPDTAVVCE